MQSITILGRLGAEPQRRTTTGGKEYVTINVAALQARDEDPTWYSCTAWGQTADVIENYVKKGDLLCLAGELKVKVKDDKTYLNVNINNVTLLPKGAAAPAGGARPHEVEAGDTYNPFLDE